MSVRWGLLGAGGISRNMFAPMVRATDDAVLQAVAARDPRRAAELEPVTVHPSYRALVEDPDVDAVYIGLQNDVHVTWAVAALEAGKHVLCEKPLAMSADEVRQMQAAADRTGRLCVEASWYRWHPRTQFVEQLCRTGETREVTCRFTIENDFAGNYRRVPELGGGALYDIGHYALSAALLSFGDGLPTSVRATVDWWDTGVDATTDVVLTYPSGTASVRLSFEEPYQNYWQVTTDSEQLTIEQKAFNPATREPAALLMREGSRQWPAENAYALMTAAVTSVFGGGDGWVLPLADSLRTATVIDACFASARSGEAVTLTEESA